MFATLVPVVVGGVIALAGSWVGPWLLETQKERAEEKKLRREKFEELVRAIYEFDHWLDMERNRALGSDTSQPAVSSFAKIQAISSLYFPEFDALIRNLDVSTQKYRVWITAAEVARASGTLTKLPDGLLEAMRPYLDTRDELTKQLSDLARRNFQRK